MLPLLFPPALFQIRLKEYGSELLEVADNGLGVSPDNYHSLTLKYHTSKISDFGDLQVHSVPACAWRGAVCQVAPHYRRRQPVARGARPRVGVCSSNAESPEQQRGASPCCLVTWLP